LPTSTDAEKIARNTAMANALELVDEIRNLDLGEISVLSGQSVAEDDEVEFVISFYEPVRKVNELDLGFKLIYTQTITLRIDA
jgi:CHASE1-domain containing sensor protein